MNEEIRAALKAQGVKQWELAEKFGYNECYFSVLMRQEFSDEWKQRALNYINQIMSEKGINDRFYEGVWYSVPRYHPELHTEYWYETDGSKHSYQVSDDVLCALKDGDTVVAYYDVDDPNVGNWCCSDSCDCIGGDEKVVAWMLLPHYREANA